MKTKTPEEVRIYIGCPLSGTTAEYRESIEKFKKRLELHFSVLHFAGLNNGSPEEIVKYDLQQIRDCDLFVGICDQTSLGLGIEIGTANSLGKPTLLVAKDENVSAMIRGNYVENLACDFRVYKNFDHLLELIEEKVASL